MMEFCLFARVGTPNDDSRQALHDDPQIFFASHEIHLAALAIPGFVMVADQRDNRSQNLFIEYFELMFTNTCVNTGSILMYAYQMCVTKRTYVLSW